MVEGGYQRPALFLLANAVQPHGVEPFKDVAVLAPLGDAAMRIDEALDLLEALFCHPEGDDDVHMVPVVLLPGIPECGGDPVPPSGVVVDEIGDPEHTPARSLHQLKASFGIRPFPLA